MKTILETKRLYLRAFIKGDGFFFYHLNNDPDVIKYTGNTSFSSLNEANFFIEKYDDYKRNGYGRWAVCLKESHEFIGWCGLKKEKETDDVDLGFRFFKKHWGKGYATEAALACIKYGFLELNLSEIIGRAHVDNKASIEVLKKCNLKFNKTFLYENKPTALYTLKNDTNKKNIGQRNLRS